MTDRLNYHDILEENLVLEMEWLKEEFEILFESKREEVTVKDKKIANDLLNYILENANVHDNFILLNVMDEITTNIEKSYPSLFNSNWSKIVYLNKKNCDGFSLEIVVIYFTIKTSHLTLFITSVGIEPNNLRFINPCVPL